MLRSRVIPRAPRALLIRQISRSFIQYRSISKPGWTHRLRTGDNSERPRNLSDLYFPLLRSWQKPRFLPAQTKLMSDKRAGARLVDRRSTRRAPAGDERRKKRRRRLFPMNQE